MMKDTNKKLYHDSNHIGIQLHEMETYTKKLRDQEESKLLSNTSDPKPSPLLDKTIKALLMVTVLVSVVQFMRSSATFCSLLSLLISLGGLYAYSSKASEKWNTGIQKTLVIGLFALAGDHRSIESGTLASNAIGTMLVLGSSTSYLSKIRISTHLFLVGSVAGLGLLGLNYSVQFMGLIESSGFRLKSASVLVGLLLSFIGLLCLQVISPRNRKMFVFVGLALLISTIFAYSHFDTSIRNSISSLKSQPTKLISSIHEVFFTETECRSKYSSQGQRTARWESSGEKAFLNLNCKEQAEEMVETKMNFTTRNLLFVGIFAGLTFFNMCLALYSETEMNPNKMFVPLLALVLIVTIFWRQLIEEGLLNPNYKPMNSYLGISQSKSPNKILSSIVGRSHKYQTVTGRFNLNNCVNTPVLLFASDSPDPVLVSKEDCKFSVKVDPASPSVFFTFDGISNKIDMKNYIVTSNRQSVDLGEIQVIQKHHGDLVNSVILKDLLTNEPIPQFKITLKKNTNGEQTEQQHNGKEGIAIVKTSREYFTITLNAEGYRPVVISSNEMIKFKVLLKYAMRIDFATDLVEMKAAHPSKGLKVSFSDQTGTRCSISRRNQVCPGALFFSKFDSSNGKVLEFVAYNGKDGLIATPSYFREKGTENHSRRRTLEEGSVDAEADSGAKNRQVYTLDDGTQVESNENGETGVELSVSSPQGDEASGSCVEDWATGVCMANPYSKTISVSVVMSDYLIYSPNITCIRPTILQNQKLKVFKFGGEGGSVWFAALYKTNFFIVVGNEEDKSYPAEIYGPDGSIVQILSWRSRRVKQNSDTFATVSLPGSEYFNIGSDIWSQVSDLPIQETPADFDPEVIFHSSNLINLGKRELGKILKRQSIEVKTASAFKGLKEKVEADGVEVEGKIFSSEKGYKVLSIPSPNAADGKDTYRVCVYCLKKEARRLSFSAEVKGQIYSYETIKYYMFMNNDDLLIRFFRDLQYKLPHNTIIQEKHIASKGIVFKTPDLEYETVDRETLASILEKQLSNSLKNTWFSPLSDQSLTDRKIRAPKVQSTGTVFTFHRGIINQFYAPDGSDFEPELIEILPKSLLDNEFGGNGLNLLRAEVNAIWREGKTFEGLFIKSNSGDFHEAWPYHMTKVDGVVLKYYLNLVEVRNSLSLTPIPGFPVREPLDNRTRPLIESLKDDVIAKEVDQLGNPHEVDYNQQIIKLSDSCMQAFFQTKSPGTFTPVNKWTRALSHNKFYIRFEPAGQVYIFRFQSLVDALEADQIQPAELNETVHDCLRLTVVSLNPNAYRTIAVNSTDAFEGYCHGEFRNHSECEGPFLGDHTSGKKSLSSFECYGNLNKERCSGKYQRKVPVNSSLYALETEGEVSPASGLIGQASNLENKTQNERTTVVCEESYDVAARACRNAKFNREKNGTGEHTDFEASCRGRFLLEEFKCEDGGFDMEYCRQETIRDDTNTCNGTYIKRTCKAGGNFMGCLDEDPDNVNIECDGGFWDGSQCKIKPVYVIVSDREFYTGTYQGDYSENLKVAGTFDARLVRCDFDISSDNLCENDPVYRFRCVGTTTKEGCSGIYKSTTKVNDSDFEMVIKTSNEPVGKDRKVASSPTTLSYFSNDGNKAISVTCQKNFSDETKACGDALYKETNKGEGGAVTSLEIACKGELDLTTLKCSDGVFTKDHCFTKYQTPAPVCNGTFYGLRCTKGGDFDNCEGRSIKNRKIACVGGTWDGSVCKPRPLYIILNNVAYVTGECDGTYVENESCEGKLNGRIVLCSVGLTPDNLCRGLAVDHFTCDGKMTRGGCEGQYLSSAKIRDANLSLETPSDAHMLPNKTLSSGRVSVGYVGELEPWRKEDFGWKALGGECGVDFSVYDRVCPATSDVKGIERYEVNRTYINASCDGSLSLDSFRCQGSKFSAKLCNSSVEPFDTEICNGTYVDVSCQNGGDLDGCQQEVDGDHRIFCDGTFTYATSECETYIKPKLSIIKVNRTHWLKGKCSDEIGNNQCVGEFTEGVFVSCQGDPVNDMEAFEACVPIPGEVFGFCSGTLSPSGCDGKYKHPIELDRIPLTAETDNDAPSCLYNFVKFGCPSILIGKDEHLDETINCDTGFNPKELTCPGYKSTFFNRKANVRIPGSSLRTSGSCAHGIFHLESKVCSAGEYEYESCFGRSHYISAEKISCLGEYSYSKCAKGGKLATCLQNTDSDIKRVCRKNYFDGDICTSSKPSGNSEIVITQQESTTMKDTQNFDNKICNFVIDSFKMEGASIQNIDMINNVIKSLDLLGADQAADGTLSHLTLLDSKYALSFDEGTIEDVEFSDFSLDELKYQSLATDDSCKLVKIRFVELNIKDTMFFGFSSKRSVIRQIRWDDRKVEDFGVDSIQSKLAFGTIIMRNVELYLPYISNSTIEKWRNQKQGKQDYRVILPKIPEISLPSYQIRFRPDSTEMYLNIPTLEIHDKSMDLILMEDFLLASDTLKERKEVVQSILNGYTEDARLASLVDETLAG